MYKRQGFPDWDSGHVAPDFWRLCIAESYCKKMSCKHLMLMLQTVKQPENGGTGYVLVVVMDGEHDK